MGGEFPHIETNRFLRGLNCYNGLKTPPKLFVSDGLDRFLWQNILDHRNDKPTLHYKLSLGFEVLGFANPKS